MQSESMAVSDVKEEMEAEKMGGSYEKNAKTKSQPSGGRCDCRQGAHGVREVVSIVSFTVSFTFSGPTVPLTSGTCSVEKDDHRLRMFPAELFGLFFSTDRIPT